MRLGIVGGGQLARMMLEPAFALGLDALAVDRASEAPAARFGSILVRSDRDPEAVAALGGCDVVTYESESVSAERLRALAERVPVHPHPDVLDVVRDRLTEKRFLQGLGIPTAPHRAVSSESDLDRALGALGLPAILKTRFGGYDGKGQLRLRDAGDAPRAWRSMGSEDLILEAHVPFDRELSLLAVRDRSGVVRHWAPVENVHVDGILRISTSPAGGVPDTTLRRARRWMEAIGEAFDYVGVFAVEFFEVDGDLIANEMACRVHNSGHWTIEGAETSQFENHVRAVAGLPLGSTRSRGSSAMLNLIGRFPDRRALLAVDRARLHDYGKEPRRGRKLGHVTVQAPDEPSRDAALRDVVNVIRDAAMDDAARSLHERGSIASRSDPCVESIRTPPWRSGRRSCDGPRSGGAGAHSA